MQIKAIAKNKTLKRCYLIENCTTIRYQIKYIYVYCCSESCIWSHNKWLRFKRSFLKINSIRILSDIMQRLFWTVGMNIINRRSNPVQICKHRSTTLIPNPAIAKKVEFGFYIHSIHPNRDCPSMNGCKMYSTCSVWFYSPKSTRNVYVCTQSGWTANF